MKKIAKYRNKKTAGFASKREAKRAQELQLLEKAGKISELRFQVAYELLEGQEDEAGKKIRPIKYVADFEFLDEFGHLITEDCKGFKTKEFLLKAKLFLWKFGRSIRIT